MNTNSKQALIESAIALFKENGYTNVSVKDICNASGVTRNAFYYHFNTKEDLLTEYFKSTVCTKESLIDELLPLKNDFERYLKLFEMHIQLFVDLGIDLTKQFLKLYTESVDSTALNYCLNGKWCISLLTSSQENELIRNDIGPEQLNKLCTDLGIGVLFSWCAVKGNFNLTELTMAAVKALLKA